MKDSNLSQGACVREDEDTTTFTLQASGFEAQPGANTFPSVCGLTATSFTDPSASPQHLFSVHDHGRQCSGRGPQHTFLPLHWTDGTISRLRAEEYDPAGDPVDSDPGAVFEDDPHPRADACRSLES